VIAKAIRFSFLAEVGGKLIQPLTFLVLANLMSPESFGVVSAAMIVVSFSQVLWEVGFSKVIIQKEHIEQSEISTLFWINFSLGLLCGFGIFFFSNQLSSFLFDSNSDIAKVLRYLSLLIIIQSSISIQTSLFQREFNFKRLFQIRLIGTLSQAISSIILVISGLDYMGLVYGLLIGIIIQAILFWRFSKFKPTIPIKFPGIKNDLIFGLWTALSALLGWFYLWVDNFFVVNSFGIIDLGLYRYGNQLPSLFFTLVFGSITPVIYSLFSRVKRDKNLLNRILVNSLQFVAITAIPIAITIKINSNLIEKILFNDEWIGIGAIIGLMSLMHGFSWIVGYNGEYFRAIGKPKYDTLIASFFLFVFALGYYFLTQYDFATFVVGRIILSFFALTGHLALIIRVSNLQAKKILYPLVFPMVTLTFYLLLDYYLIKNLISQIILSLSLILIYFMVYRSKYLDLINFLFANVKKRINSNS